MCFQCQSQLCFYLDSLSLEHRSLSDCKLLRPHWKRHYLCHCAFVKISCKTGHLSYAVPGHAAVATFTNRGEERWIWLEKVQQKCYLSEWWSLLSLSLIPDYQEGRNATEPFHPAQDDGNWTLLECPPGFQWCHLTNLCSSLNNCCNATECANISLASSPTPVSPQHNGSQLSYELVKEFLFTIPAGPSSQYLVSVY